MTRFARLRDLLTRVSTYMAIFALISACYGIFGQKPHSTWQEIRHEPPDGTPTTLPSSDPTTVPADPDTVVYKRVPVTEVDQRVLAEKISAVATLIFTILAALIGQVEPPPDKQKDPNLDD